MAEAIAADLLEGKTTPPPDLASLVEEYRILDELLESLPVVHDPWIDREMNVLHDLVVGELTVN